MDPRAFLTKFGGNQSDGQKYGIGMGMTTAGGAPTPKPVVTEGKPSGPVPLTTEPGYSGASARTTFSKDSGPDDR